MTQDEYDAVMEVFTSEGWKIILEDIEKTNQSLCDIRNLQSNEEFFIAKGAIKQLDWFLRLEDWYQFAWDDHNAEI